MASIDAQPKLAVGDEFPDLQVDAVDGQVALRERWREGPLVVAYMRQFG